MWIKTIFFLLLSQFVWCSGFSQVQTHGFRASLRVNEHLAENFHHEGRLFVFFSQNPGAEPRTQTWPVPWSKAHIFAQNLKDFNSSVTYMIEHSGDWISTPDWTLDEIPAGEYFVQVLWDQDTGESTINAPGNLYSTKQQVNLLDDVELEIELDQLIKPRQVLEHQLVREIDFESRLLSEWWDKPVNLKASILLPAGYTRGRAYPIRYQVAGYGGRYTRINSLIRNEEFMNWWASEEAPDIINVFLDGEGPFGDSYQMDSENSGPYGTALIEEFIPYIERKYRGTETAETRFVDGCSTGGWVSLGLQLYYPEFFNGCFSYSPDAVEFENYLLTDIYKEKNFFYNEYGYPQPVMRSTKGDPMMFMKDFVLYENVLGSSNTYLTSGGQMGSHTALYSPKGENGLPKPLFDPLTGEIDPTVAEHWKKYDFKIFARENWTELGPKIQGKIFIWMGDMDNFYLNLATRAFSEFLKTTENPRSDAEIIFTPTEGHCSFFSHKEVLLKIQEKLKASGSQ